MKDQTKTTDAPIGPWTPISQHPEFWYDGDAYLLRIPMSNGSHEIHLVYAVADDETPVRFNDQYGESWFAWDWDDADSYIKLSELDRLYAIKQRLSRTANGVFVLPGDRIYPLHPLEDVGVDDYAEVVAAVRDSVSGEVYVDGDGEIDISKNYSSPEAATKAREGVHS